MRQEEVSALGPNRRLGTGLAFFGMLGISTDSLFIRLADTDGFDITFWIGVFTATILFAVVIIRDRRSPIQLIRAGGWPLWLAGALQAVSTCVFVLAVTQTSVSNVVVIIAAAPIIAAVLSTLILQEPSPRRIWIAVIGVGAGVLLVVSGSIGGGAIVGDLLALLAITIFGFSLVLLRRFPSIDRVAMVALGGVGMALIAVGPATIFGHTGRTWVALVLMGFLFGPLGRVLISCLLYTSPSPRDATLSRMPSSA